jgi:hypothetical protein
MNDNPSSIEPKASIHFDAFSEPHTIPSGWDVAAFMGPAFESVQPFSPNFHTSQPSGDRNADYDDVQNAVS